MRPNQTQGDEIDGQGISVPRLGRFAEMNIKLIRNAMFVTAIIVVISVVGKVSAHDEISRSVVNADDMVWVEVGR